MEKIVLIGCGGHAKSVVDAIEAAGEYTVAGFVATQAERDVTYRGYRVLGTDGDLEKIYADGVTCAAVCVGFMGEGRVRDRLAERVKAVGFTLPAIVDPSAVIAADAELAEGVFVGKRAVVNSAAGVEPMAIVNTAAVVEHDCRVGAYSHVAVGAVLCGGVTVGEHTLIGAGATVLQCRHLGADVRVGGGATVLADVPDGVTVVGVYKG